MRLTLTPVVVIKDLPLGLGYVVRLENTSGSSLTRWYYARNIDGAVDRSVRIRQAYFDMVPH